MTTKLEQAARQALEALETDEQWGFVNKKVLERRLPAITALREALAEQTEQAPVGEMIDKAGYKGAAWYLEPPATGTKLYAAPVRTKDLTDNEINKISHAIANTMSANMTVEDWKRSFARAVIAADREKNK